MMALVIGLHNIPEGMAVAVPLAAGGASRGRAVLTTAVAGAHGAGGGFGLLPGNDGAGPADAHTGRSIRGDAVRGIR